IFVCLVLVLYQLLSAKVHPAIAGFLVTALIAIPEMYAYSFMALFDFPNAVYFFLAAWFLSRFLSEEHRGDLLMAAWMMGIATYIRSETLILAFLMLPVFFVAGRKLVFKRTSFIGAVIFLTAAVLAYLLSVTVYVNLYLPAGYEISRLLNNNLLNLESLAARFAGMNRELIFSSHGVEYFGYFIFLFLLILLGDALATRHWNLQARHYLYGILVIYLGLPVIGFLLPLMDLEHSTKRGMFKLFPLMVLYMGNCGLLQRLSQRLDTWSEITAVKDRRTF
ncbi:MAG TPA: hypothetical protein VFZ78_10805, partial [Flavisolibacter sp.]